MSVHVPSQIRSFPFLPCYHGDSIWSFTIWGRKASWFQSWRWKVCWTMSLIAACPKRQPNLGRQLSSCKPKCSTSTPHCWRAYSQHSDMLSFTPIATWKVLFSIQRPGGRLGRVFSQAPDTSQKAASKIALIAAFVAFFDNSQAIADTLNVSHVFCFCWLSTWGGDKTTPLTNGPEIFFGMG